MNAATERAAALFRRRQALIDEHAAAVQTARDRIAAEERRIKDLQPKLATAQAELASEAFDMLADLTELDERPPVAAPPAPQGTGKSRARTTKETPDGK